MEKTYQQSSGAKWVEGFILLLLITVVILYSVCSSTKYTTIFDEKVSAWSGERTEDMEIDNLK